MAEARGSPSARMVSVPSKKLLGLAQQVYDTPLEMPFR